MVYEFFARCAGGFESRLATELKKLKAQRVRPLKGGVAFFGTVEDAYRACLWSRVASRVLLIITRVDARDAEELYVGAKSVVWEDHIPLGTSIAVYAHGVNESLRNTQFTAVKVKDAVCDRLRDLRGERPNVEGKRPDIAIDVAIRGERATMAIDLSGEPLHRRGYRKQGEQTEAPLKETLAASIVLESGWQRKAAIGGMFVDPLCGSGTLAIEAAMIAADMAPGIMRDYWGFTRWSGHEEDVWNDLIDEADERLAVGIERMPRIVGGDVDPYAIELSRENAKRAGLADRIDFQVCDAAELGNRCGDEMAASEVSGLVCTNPPYGERLSSEAQLPAVYEALAEGMAAVPEGWTLSVITPDESIDAALGLDPSERKPFFNGPIEAELRLYEVKPSERILLDVLSLDGTARKVAIAEKNSDQFAARFRKVARERIRWARRAGVCSFRLYDADLPDYSVAIDLYEGAGKTAGQLFVHVSEYQAPSEIDPERAQRRFRDVLAIVPCILGISAAQVFSKTRRKDKGGGQYRDAGGRSFKAYTKESGHLLEIDLGGYLDTGLFLDHRITRELVGRMARDKHFLNLFAYTGVATVHAASGGAASTTTIDLSQTYLSWAERNMGLNGYHGRKHRYIRTDVVRWISEERSSTRRYDLIFVDPPTFSNSKSMGKDTWSVQRDHVELLIGVSRLLTPGGKAIFSCNLRSFKPDLESLERYGVKLTDVSAQTIPEDFSRNPKIHHCYIVEHVK